MYRYQHGSDRSFIPSGLPARLVDPTLRTLGDKPQFLRIGEGDDPRNELLRKVYQQPSKDVVRTKVIGDIYPPTEKEAYLARPENIAAIRTASEQLGIPLERTGLRIATNPFRLEGDITNVNAATELIGKASSNLAKQGKPVFYDALTRKAKFFNQPTSYSELAVDGTEGVEAIMEAYEKAEPRRTASSQGNRPILMQADGLDPNIGIPSGNPENIPPMDIEGMKGANRYVDVSQGLETARTIQYPNIYDRLNNGAQPIVTATIPYSLDIPNSLSDSILSPKVSIETKRPRFIDEGTGIYTRQGEPINAEQKNLLDTGMADLEDRSFILRDPVDLARQPARALASQLPVNYYGVERDIPTGVDAIIRGFGRRNPKTGLLEGNVNAQGYLQTDLPSNYYGIPRDIPTDLRADYGRTGRRGLTSTRDELPLTREIGSVVGSQLGLEQHRPTTRLAEPLPTMMIGPAVLDNTNTYGKSQGRTPWREYYSDPFVYEDKGLDSEVNRLMRAVNEAPAQLENAYTQQSSANRRAINASDKLRMLGQHQSVRMGLLPQGEGLVNLAREVRKDRRMAEIDVAKANDTIAQLKAAQELMGVEYMVKPKLWDLDTYNGYRRASRNFGGVKNQFTRDYPSGNVLDPVDYENAMTDLGITGSRNLWRDEPDRDYDIASLFGFNGNY